MTIEIRQLVIRAVVGPGGEAATRPAVEPPAAPARVETAPQPDPDVLVAACVREVLRRIERSRER